MLLIIGAILLFNLFLVLGLVVRDRRMRNEENSWKEKVSLAEKQLHNSVAYKTAKRELDRKLKSYSENISRKQAEHLEMFAAAYLKYTSIPPDQVELVQEIKDHSKVVWYFREKENVRAV